MKIPTVTLGALAVSFFGQQALPQIDLSREDIVPIVGTNPNKTADSFGAAIERKMRDSNRDTAYADLTAIRMSALGREKEGYILSEVIGRRLNSDRPLGRIELHGIAREAKERYEKLYEFGNPSGPHMQGVGWDAAGMAITKIPGAGFLYQGVRLFDRAAVLQAPSYLPFGKLWDEGRTVNVLIRSQAPEMMRTGMAIAEEDPEFALVFKQRLEAREKTDSTPLMPEGLFGATKEQVLASGDPYARMMTFVDKNDLEQSTAKIQESFRSDSEKLRQRQNEMEDKITGLKTQIDQANSIAERIDLHARLQAAREQKRQQEQRAIETIKANAREAQAALGLIDIAAGALPKDAQDAIRKSVAIGSFAVSVREQLLLVGKGVTPLGATFAVAQGAQSLFSLLGNGPSINTQILQELTAIRGDISDLGERMDHRFDHVDAELLALNNLVLSAFNQLSKGQADIGETLHSMDMKLNALSSDLGQIGDQIDALLDQDRAERMRATLRKLDPRSAAEYSINDRKVALEELRDYAAKSPYDAAFAYLNHPNVEFSWESARSVIASRGAVGGGPDIPELRLNYIVKLLLVQGTKDGKVDPRLESLAGTLLKNKIDFQSRYIPNYRMWRQGSARLREALHDFPILNETQRRELLAPVEQAGRDIEELLTELRSPQVMSFLLERYEAEAAAGMKAVADAESRVLKPEDKSLPQLDMNVWTDRDPKSVSPVWRSPPEVKYMTGKTEHTLKLSNECTNLVPEDLRIAAALGLGTIELVAIPDSYDTGKKIEILIKRKQPSGKNMGGVDPSLEYESKPLFRPMVRVSYRFRDANGKSFTFAEARHKAGASALGDHLTSADQAKASLGSINPGFIQRGGLPAVASESQLVQSGLDGARGSIKGRKLDYRTAVLSAAEKEITLQEAKLEGIAAILGAIIEVSSPDAYNIAGGGALVVQAKSGTLPESFVARHKKMIEEYAKELKTPEPAGIVFAQEARARLGFDDGYAIGSAGEIAQPLPSIDQLSRQIQDAADPAGSARAKAAMEEQRLRLGFPLEEKRVPRKIGSYDTKAQLYPDAIGGIVELYVQCIGLNGKHTTHSVLMRELRALLDKI